MASQVHPSDQHVKVDTLPVSYVKNIHSQVQTELQVLSDTANQLDTLVKKYKCSALAIEKNSRLKSEQVLIPCTESLYVEGTSVDNELLLVDIGTGYYVEMTPAAAISFFNRRVEYITQQIKNVEKLINEKAQILTAIEETLIKKSQDSLSAQVEKATI